MQGEAEHVVNNMMFDFSNGVYIYMPQNILGSDFLVAVVNEGRDELDWVVDAFIIQDI